MSPRPCPHCGGKYRCWCNADARRKAATVAPAEPAGVDVALVPERELKALLELWRRRVDILRRCERDAEARRVEECESQLRALFATATLDSTTTRS